jgi:two-component system cell cycle sensor histidine kinase/response regulator CckA
MNYSTVSSIVLSLLPCVIPPYALRLMRVFGAKRVGWVLFAAFTMLALLQLVRALQPLGLGLDARLTMDLVNFLVPVLLLAGMVHIETIFKERQAHDEEEQRLRAELQAQVQQRTAELDQANEELQREISLRKQGEEELRKSKEQYRFLFDENPQPMWIYDLRSLQFLAFNAAALRQFGYNRNEFRSMTLREICLSGDANSFSPQFTPRNGNQRKEICQLCKRDGAILEAEVTAMDLVYAGAPARLILANDLSAQRALQKQLLQSQKAQVTNQLAGGVADNFSRLISVIENDAQSLAQQCDDLSAVEPLKRITATAGCAAGLTRQLLALVRRHPMQTEHIDLNAVVERQTAQIVRMLGSKIALEKVCWGNLPPIVADPVLIEQIIRALVLNSREAMTNGGSVTISTAPVQVDETRARRHPEARSGAFVCLTISDTGSGITPEIQARLFEPFFTTKDPGKSPGLGLATVHGLVKQHNGWIEFSTQPGTGSRFTAFFPATPGGAYRAAQQQYQSQTEIIPAEV